MSIISLKAFFSQKKGRESNNAKQMKPPTNAKLKFRGKVLKPLFLKKTKQEVSPLESTSVSSSESFSSYQDDPVSFSSNLKCNVHASVLLTGELRHGSKDPIRVKQVRRGRKAPQVSRTKSDTFLLDNNHGAQITGDQEPDVYGQVHPHETPELIARKLTAFDRAVTALPQEKKAVLNQAACNCPQLLTKDFKLLFLRCETFQVQLAVKRYIKYWDMRLEIFGHCKAFQPLTQTEACSEDGAALSIGFSTILGTKDSQGRTIVYVDYAKQDFEAYSAKSLVRSLWYVFHAALEDEETQKKGIILLADVKHSSLATFDKDRMRLIAASVQGCIPVRLSGVHACRPRRVFHVVFPLVKLVMGERLKKRIFLHGASSFDGIIDGLSKFGITKTDIPTTLGGDLVVDNEAWLAGSP